MMHPMMSRAFANQTLRMTICGIFLMTVFGATLSGCGKSTPEERLEAVGEDLSDSTSELESLNAQIEETEKKLAGLRDVRRDVRDRMRTLEQRLEARATDVAIFRAVQSALLADAVLSESAIGVSVDDGRVALTGVVRSDEEARRAVAIAMQTTGVNNVTSKIRVDDPTTSNPGSS